MKQSLKKIIPAETIKSLHKPQSQLAALRHGLPARKLTIIGVTGTNGKTSVCHYITQILQDSGYKVGMLTTVAISINGKRQLNKTKMTTLSATLLHKYLKQMVDAGCTHAVVETTSHALDQHRVYGLYYDTVVFTNLSHEHLDYHKTMKEYQAAKEKLFMNRPRVMVVNADDPVAPDFLRHPAHHKFSYGILDQLRPKVTIAQPDVSASLLKLNHDQTSFHLETPFGQTVMTMPLPGRFTVSNVLAALCVGLGFGLDLNQMKATVAKLVAVEGRLEPVDQGQDFSVIVDFAHTPDALQQVYSTLRPMVKGRMIAVLGSMGNRDKTKRPILGALAARYADLVIITNEDPVTEDPQAIINEVAGGVPRGRPQTTGAHKGKGEWWWKITDRREAIAKALSMAKKDDLVIITGKGGEHVMAVGDKLIPWNDVNVVKECLTQIQAAYENAKR